MAISQFERGAKLETPFGEDVLVLQSCTLSEELCGGFHGDIVAVSENPELSARDIIGKTVTVSFDTSTKPRFFNGHVASFLFAGMSGRLARYVLTLKPWMHVLSLRSDCRIHLKKTVKDIIEETIGLTPFSDKLDMSELSDDYVEREFCVQYNETTADFLHRLMVDEGIVSRYRHDAEGHTLVLSDWNDRFEPIEDYETVKWYPPERQSREVESIGAWRWTNRMSPGAFVTDDYDFKVPTKTLLNESVAPDGFAHDDGEIYSWPGGFIEPSHGDRVAHIRREQLQVVRETVEAESNAAGLRPGHIFSLEKFPREEANKSWLVTRVTHRITGLDYESGGGGAAEYINSMTVSDPAHLYRPARRVARPRIYGAQTARVTGPEGEEISTDEHGRITVHFPWDRHGPQDADSSCWIRVAQTWAGPGWGAQFIPRIGQEVIVEFIDGNPDKPIVTGCVYNGKNKPPFELPANKTQSGVKTNSTKNSPGYNMIRFEDQAGAEELKVHAERDMTRIIRRDFGQMIGRNHASFTEGNVLSEVEGGMVTNVEKGVSIVSGTQGLDLSQKVGIGIQAHRVSEAPRSLHRGNFASMKPGSITLSAQTDRRDESGQNSSEVVGKNKSIGVGESMRVSTGKSFRLDAKTDGHLSSQKAFFVHAKEQIRNSVGQVTIIADKIGDLTTECGRDVVFSSGRNVTVNAADTITLTVGSSSIQMTSDGDITISGKNITLEGSSSIKLSSSRIDLN